MKKCIMKMTALTLNTSFYDANQQQYRSTYVRMNV